MKKKEKNYTNTENGYDNNLRIFTKIFDYEELASNQNRIIICRKWNKDDDCPICFDSLKNKMIKITPCKHKFHLNCFEKWANSNANYNWSCPSCRKELDLF